jgi:DNA-binding winged helix-turn-helix (wHTH) protein
LDTQQVDLDRGFRLEDWVVLPRQSSLSKAGNTVRIEPKVMGVLVCLARHAPETVTRDEIFDEVWAGTIVQDEALSRNVSLLRSHFGDDAAAGQYIQTIPRVGYRLLAEVKPLKSEKDNSRVYAVSIAVAIALAGILIWVSVAGPEGDPTPANADVEEALHNTRLISHLLMLGDADMLKRKLQQSIQSFERALESDPTRIEARLGLAKAHALLPSYDVKADPVWMYAKARAELQAVVETGADPERTYATEAFIHLRRMEWIKAEERFTQAIEYDPNDAHLRQWYSQFLSRVGLINKSIEQAQISLTLDPHSPVSNHRLGTSYTWAGRSELANEQFSLARKEGIAPYTYKEPEILLHMRAGEYEVMTSLLGAVQESQSQQVDWVPLLIDALKNPTPESKRKCLDAIEAAWRKKQLRATFYVGVPILLDEPKSTLAILNELLVDDSLVDVVEGMFIPEMRTTRAEPRFFTLVQELGLDEYWAAYGLPDVCHGETKEVEFCGRLTADRE